MPARRIVYEFGDFRLDAAQRQLLLKAPARPLPLTSKAFDTLLFLVEHRGELVDKVTLMRAIWPNAVVEENSLNQNISLLRRVLGECPGEYRFIVTVPGHGYRFVASVSTVEESPGDSPYAQTSATTQPRIGALARTSIAVLPFVNLSGDPAMDWCGEALAEGIIDTLVRVRWFKVASRTSAFAFKGRTADVRQIARDLNVEAVLEGSIRCAGNSIRVTAQLVDGRSGHHAWSQSCDRGREDLSAVLDEITISIVDAIAGHFVLRTTRRRRPTQHLDAYQLYLDAMTLRVAPTEPNLEAAMQLLHRALTRDPSFGRAAYALAEIYAHRAAGGICDSNMLDAAEREAGRALSLDPTMPGAHAVLAIVNTCRGRWIEAENELRAAECLMATNPETLFVHAAYVARQTGHYRLAMDQIRDAYELAPASPGLAFQVGLQKLLEGSSSEAQKWMDAAIANGYPRTSAALQDACAELAMQEGRFAEAAQELSESLPPASRAAGGFEAVQLFLAALSAPSRRTAAIAALQAWEAQLRVEGLDQLHAQRLMVWFTLLGAIDAAHDVAMHRLDRLAPSGTIGCGWGVLWRREMQAFSAHPRFQELVSRMGLIPYWQQYGAPDGFALRGSSLIRS
jgi:TolB-like protein/Tfp pilus assembly protein PilF